MTRRFTGWHMTAIMFAFFGVVVSVNMLMATLATRTFGGTVVENSYVASQSFNRWLAEARAQDRLQRRPRGAGQAARHGIDRRLGSGCGEEPEPHQTDSTGTNAPGANRERAPPPRLNSAWITDAPSPFAGF